MAAADGRKPALPGSIGGRAAEGQTEQPDEGRGQHKQQEKLHVDHRLMPSSAHAVTGSGAVKHPEAGNRSIVLLGQHWSLVILPAGLGADRLDVE